MNGLRVQSSPVSLRIDVGAPAQANHVDRAREAAQLDLAERLGDDALRELLELHRRHQHVEVVGVVAQAGRHVDGRPDVVVALEQQRVAGGDAGAQGERRAHARCPPFEIGDELDRGLLLDGHDHAAVAEPLGDAGAALGGDLADQRAERAEDPAGGVVAVRGGVVREPRQVEEDERPRHPHRAKDTCAADGAPCSFLRYVGRDGDTVHLLAVGRDAARVRSRRRRAVRPAHRRVAVSRRRQRRPAADDAGGHARTRRRADRRVCATCSTRCARSARNDSSSTTWAACTTRSPRARRHRRRGAPRHRQRRAATPRRAATSAASQTARDAAAERHMQLDLMPDDLAGKVRELSNYDFESNEAQQRVRAADGASCASNWCSRSSTRCRKACRTCRRGDMQRMKDMLAALNEMLDKHQRGEDPGFEQFMEQFGDFFPENPQTLDELLEQMARRMAAMQAMMNSMTPEQRAQLQQLVRAAAGRHGPALAARPARLQPAADVPADELGPVVRLRRPATRWASAQAMQAMQDLGDLDQLENLLQNATNPAALAEADMDRVRDLLGDDAAQSLERLSQLTKMLEEAGLIENKEGRLELTPQGLRAIGSNALRDLFSKLTKEHVGQHQLHREGLRPRARRTRPSRTSSAIRSSSICSARSATRSGARAAARRCACTPTTSRSSAPSTSRGPAPC